MNDQQLLFKTEALVKEERQIGIEILKYFREIQERRAYVEAGCTSLFEYATKVLKYSEASAYRRISAMKILSGNPEVVKMLHDGKLSVTTISQVESFLKFEKIQNKKIYSTEEKHDLLSRVQEKTTRQVERELIVESKKITSEIPAAKPWIKIRPESVRAVGANHIEITFTAEKALCRKLQRVRDLAAHRLGRDGSYAALIDLMAELALDKLDPLKNIEKRARNRSEHRVLQ